MRRALAAGISVLALLATLTGLAPAAAAHTPYCGITWGSLAKSGSAHGSDLGHVTGVRAGRHPCFDRFVVDIDGPAGDYWVQYQDQVTTEGQGVPIPLRGAADLAVVTARAYDEMGDPTFTPADESELVDLDGFRTLQQAAFGGSFEGQSTIGLGVRARLPFRVLVLDGPGSGSRLVVDVAHRW